MDGRVDVSGSALVDWLGGWLAGWLDLTWF